MDTKCFFLSGPAGTGKTLVFNILAAHLRLQGLIVLTVASTHAAALLLQGKTTGHLRFAFPMDAYRGSECK